MQVEEGCTKADKRDKGRKREKRVRRREGERERERSDTMGKGSYRRCLIEGKRAEFKRSD